MNPIGKRFAISIHVSQSSPNGISLKPPAASMAVSPEQHGAGIQDHVVDEELLEHPPRLAGCGGHDGGGPKALVAGEGVRGHERELGVARKVGHAGFHPVGQPGVVGIEERDQRS